jgi:hypothetical protein
MQNNTAVNVGSLSKLPLPEELACVGGLFAEAQADRSHRRGAGRQKDKESNTLWRSMQANHS